MTEDKTLDNLVRKADRLRKINKYILMLQIPITILAKTPSGLENYLNSKIAAACLSENLNLLIRFTEASSRDSDDLMIFIISSI